MKMSSRKSGLSLVLVIGWILAAALPALAEISLDHIREMAAAQVSIERMRKQKAPDWTKIKDKYEVLAPMVKQTDAQKSLAYDREIRAAIKKCAAGEKTKVNMQTLAKGLQHVVVLNIRDELSLLGESDGAGKRIAALFEGIRPTFTRRDKDFYKAEPTLEKAADRALGQIKKGGDKVSLTAPRELADIIDRTYGLCVLYEIIKVEKLRDTDTKSCEVKVKEADIFYRIIQDRIKKHDAKAHEVISGMLKAGYDRMDADLLETYLNQGLSGISLR